MAATDARRYLDRVTVQRGIVLLVDDDEQHDEVLGRVAPRRHQPAGWGFTVVGHQDPAEDGSRLYCSELAAGQACAIQATEGPAARAEFDASQPLPVPIPPRRASGVSGPGENGGENEPGS